MMCVILMIVGLVAGLLSGSVGFGGGMMIGNFIAMRCIRNVNKKLYQKIVAGIMIAVSLWLIISTVA